MLRLQSLLLTSCNSLPFKHQFLQSPIVSCSASSSSSSSVRSKMESKSYTTRSQSSSNKLLFRQLFEKESFTYSYLLGEASYPDKPALTKVPGVKSIISKVSKASADILVEAGDKIMFGDLYLEVRQLWGIR